MSWQLASFGLIAIVLAGGAVWYERSRPPARLVGLVAALAALAVAGRVALAPAPNLVATTDIALLTGFSLGAAPGFAVGALAGLVSNIWLGQGPWTPWQMTGWGLVGIGGAVLARLTLRRAGRGTLAIAAGFAGLAYGALLDLSVMITYGGEQSLDRYLGLSVRGIPFNVTHAIGNVAIIWVAGPAIVRMLERYRVRASFVWHPQPGPPSRTPRYTGAIGALVALVALAAVVPAAIAGPSSDATQWLEAKQNDDGGWGNAPGAPSSPAMTSWVMLGLESAGMNPRDLDGPDPVRYLRKRVKQVRSATDLERTILALEGAGVSADVFAGRNLVAELANEQRADGSWRGGVNPTAFGVLALDAAGRAGGDVRRSVGWLARAQNPDGGWGFDRGAGSDPDSSGAALQALAAGSGDRSAIRDGVKYLRRAQRGDGGFPAQAGLTSNSQSTAWAAQGLVAAGVNLARVRKREASPIDFLRRRQAGDGHVAYSRRSDQTPVWVTAQAVTALEGVAFPVDAVAREPRPPKVRDPATGAGPPVGGGGDGKRSGTPTRPAGNNGKKGKNGRKAGPKREQPKRKRRAKAKPPSDEDARAEREVVNGSDRGATGYAPLDAVGGEEDDDGLPALAWAGIALALAAAAGAWLYRRRFS